MDKLMFIPNKGKQRPPKSVVEYFTVLYCDRRKSVARLTREPATAWSALSPAEQKVFIDKFEKWQADNEKKMTSIVECAEPFMKKKATKEKARTKSHKNTSVADYTDSQPGSMNISANSHGEMANANLEESKLELDLNNVEFFMNDYDDDQSQSMMNLVYDNSSNTNLGTSNQHYTASVIDTDIDEPTAQEEINENEAVTNAALPEPTVTKITSKELFGIIKASGTRPELANVEWKHLTRTERRPYHKAVTKMRQEYLVKYEKYLESLPSPELFKHYIKFKSEN